MTCTPYKMQVLLSSSLYLWAHSVKATFVLHLSVHRYVVNFSHFQLPLQNDCMPSHQTYHKCSSRDPEEGLYLFEVLRIPSSLSWLLIGRHIFHFFSRTTAYEISRFARNVSLGVLKKCFSVV